MSSAVLRLLLSRAHVPFAQVSLKLSCDGLDATASAPFVMGDREALLCLFVALWRLTSGADVYRLSLDSQATSYESLFMQHKTTERAAYKDAAVRAGAPHITCEAR